MNYIMFVTGIYKRRHLVKQVAETIDIILQPGQRRERMRRWGELTVTGRSTEKNHAQLSGVPLVDLGPSLPRGLNAFVPVIVSPLLLISSCSSQWQSYSNPRVSNIFQNSLNL